MIEYVSKPGGRHLYNEDMINLQNMALSFTEFFKCFNGGFIIYGCEHIIDRENNVEFFAEGYLWLAGKIRYVPRTKIKENGIPLYRYILPNDVLGNSIIYATPGINGPISKDYGVKFVENLPEGYDDDESYIKLWRLNYDYYDTLSIAHTFGQYCVSKIDAKSVDKPVDFLNVISYDGIDYGWRIGRDFEFSSITLNIPSLIIDYSEGSSKTTVDFNNRTITFNEYRHYNDVIGENLTNKQIKLPTVNTKDVTSSIVNVQTMSIRGVSLNIILRPKTPNTSWLPLSGTDNLVAKQVDLDVFITGRLPFADGSVIIKATEMVGEYLIRKQTTVKLPDSIAKPPTNMVFNVRGGNHCYYNGSANLFFDSDGYLCIEMDSRELFNPNPSSVCWHYIAD